MLEHLFHLLEWAARWPGTPAAFALGAAAGFWRQARPVACALALVAVTVPMIFSDGTGARFVAATFVVVFLAVVALSRRRRLDERSGVLWGLALGLLVLLCGLQVWDAGSIGLAAGTESALPWARWLLAWPGSGLVAMVALTGLRLLVAPRSPAEGLAAWLPFGLALALATALLGWEGRPRILEASLLLGLLSGGAASALPLLRGSRAVHAAVGALCLLSVWSFAVREGRGAGAYVHPAGLELEGRVEYEIIDSQLQLPSALTHSPDGRVFVADFATEIIWVYALQDGTWKRSVFTRWPQAEGSVPAVGSSEAGLWGLAFDPEGGWLYAMGIERWVPQPGPDERARGLSRILRFEDMSGGEPAWELVLGDLPAGTLHSGGALAFGPRGALYVSVGDGGYGGPGRQELVGTILRLPSSVLGSDPALRSAGASRSLVYARGLRNPYGLDFGADGRLYATENGPDCCDRLLRVDEGADFGWRAGGAAVDLQSLASDPSLSLPLWDSGPSRIGPTGLVVGEGALHFVTWHTAALHAVELDSSGVVEAHRIRFDGASARPPEASVYRFSGGFTGLSRGADGRLWFTAVGALGRFSL